jgi:hypothetical protein
MLTFDPATHSYRYDGVAVPSVTQILAPLSDFSFVDPHVLEAARAFGTAVHYACELDDRGELDEEALDPALLPYLQQWRKFCREHACKWEWIERKVYHERMRYAGTLDRAGFIDGARGVLDIKSGSDLYPSVGPQLAAYAMAIEPATGHLLRRYGLRLHPTGYELKAYTSPTDWPVFASLITLRTFCTQHRITPNFKELSHV